MDDLAQWLGEQLDEDERIARAVRVPHDWHQGPGDDDPEWVGDEMVLMWPPEFHTPYEQDKHWRGLTVEGSEMAAHIAAHDPARVQREVEAKRLLLERWLELQARIDAEGDDEKRGRLALTRHGLDMFVYQLGTIYRDRPGYREEWRPS